MANVLNFNTAKKQYLTITLPDAKQTTIMVCTPTKALLNRLENMETDLTEGSDSVMDDLYELIAQLMSRNKGGVKITREQLEECLDIEDVIMFIKSYKTFLGTIQNLKN